MTARDRPELIRGTWVVLGGVAAQAIVGGITVLTGLNPWIVGFHFLCSMAIIAVSAWLLWRYPQGAGPTRSLVHPLVDRTTWALAAWELYAATGDRGRLGEQSVGLPGQRRDHRHHLPAGAARAAGRRWR